MFSKPLIPPASLRTVASKKSEDFHIFNVLPVHLNPVFVLCIYPHHICLWRIDILG